MAEAGTCWKAVGLTEMIGGFARDAATLTAAGATFPIAKPPSAPTRSFPPRHVRGLGAAAGQRGLGPRGAGRGIKRDETVGAVDGGTLQSADLRTDKSLFLDSSCPAPDWDRDTGTSPDFPDGVPSERSACIAPNDFFEARSRSAITARGERTLTRCRRFARRLQSDGSVSVTRDLSAFHAQQVAGDRYRSPSGAVYR